MATNPDKKSPRLIYGLNPVTEAMRAKRPIKALYISSGRHKDVAALREEAEKQGIPIKVQALSFFEKFPKGHQGIAAEVAQRLYTQLEELLKIPAKRGEAPFFVVLDLIEDPRNFGAILRTAEAAGVHGVIIQKKRAAGLGPEASKASAGASEYMPVSAVANIKHAIEKMQEAGIGVIGAEAGGDHLIINAWEADMSGPVALVIGSEGRGLRKTVREKCDFTVSLPVRGKVNSLNASVAAGILVYEVLRQRGHRPFPSGIAR